LWSGSKLGWLVALAMGGLWVLRLDWPRRGKILLVTGVMVIGLAGFAWRFQSYFATGAKSVGARFDYWVTAVQVVQDHPVFGSGPGTFQRPYATRKAPEAEMARLVHNDYLEQFSDSGIPGGIAYLAWIGLAAVWMAVILMRGKDLLLSALAVGVLGWYLQGLGEFGLYVPALAWVAFTLTGVVLGGLGKALDTPRPAK
jgi:O-antigen ligase